MRRVCARAPIRATAAVGAAAAAGSQLRSLSFNPRMKEYHFLMDVLDMYGHYEKLGCSSEVNAEIVESILEECSKLSTQSLFPLYQSGDQEGCVLKDNKVTTPKGYKEAWDQIVQGGWQGLAMPEKYGGQGLPASIGVMQKEMMATANWSLLMYPGLSAGAATTLLAHGNEQQKELYLRKIIEGTWMGTMCLTEPQCGTDLGQVKTRATDNGDGTYSITGTKIFISAGDHDLSENIVHIVLARLPNAPEGTKGISLFVVPRNLPKNADGSELDSNLNVTCVRLENKMGIKASATAQLAFDGSKGWMIGGPNEGMKQMFTFMNTARVGTAVQGVAHAELAFQNALWYAKERHSMRALTGTKNPDKPADAIIHHPTVKQAVLFAKCIAEGGRAFVFDMAKLVDKYEAATTPEEKKKWDDELGMLTPIAKGCLTELGLEAANGAVQCYGGHGFIRENGVEQIVRDARISTLYEGTTGVQALDLIGRKVMMSKTGAHGRLMKKISAECQKNLFATGPIGTHSRTLYRVNMMWRATTMSLMAASAANKNQVGASSVDFMYYSGYIVLGYYWLKMAIKAQEMIDKGRDHDGFYKTKIDMFNFYFHRVFPRQAMHQDLMTRSPLNITDVDTDKLDL